MANKMNASEQLVDFYLSFEPRKIWEIDKETLAKVRAMHDDAHVYFWKPEPNYKDMPGTLFGIPVSISKDKCFQIKHIFKDGSEHVEKFDLEI